MSATLGTFVVRSIIDHISPSFDKALVQIANETNKTLPLMVDNETRLDATIANPGNSFTYSYTLVNYTKERVNISDLNERVRPQIIANYKSHPQMQYFRDHNVELHYQYKDKNEVFITEIVVSPKDF